MEGENSTCATTRAAIWAIADKWDISSADLRTPGVLFAGRRHATAPAGMASLSMRMQIPFVQHSALLVQ